jgi:hypothetical protein
MVAAAAELGLLAIREGAAVVQPVQLLVFRYH